MEGIKNTVQYIDAICFSDFGFLKNKFEYLYPSLFESTEKYVKTVRASS
jgi:hypothetical protein